MPADPRLAVWPADGTLAAQGTAVGGRMVQAKGLDYTLDELLGDPALANAFEGGTYATVYLAPRDYHRVHAPVAGSLRRRIHRSGRLYSVNAATTAAVPGLFTGNERVVLLFEHPHAGLWALVLVGALIIGGIETVWEGTVNPLPGGVEADRHFTTDGPEVARGDEVGLFRAGSTVITLFAHNRLAPHVLDTGSRLRMGTALGRLRMP